MHFILQWTLRKRQRKAKMIRLPFLCSFCCCCCCDDVPLQRWSVTVKASVYYIELSSLWLWKWVKVARSTFRKNYLDFSIVFFVRPMCDKHKCQSNKNLYASGAHFKVAFVLTSSMLCDNIILSHFLFIFSRAIQTHLFVQIRILHWQFWTLAPVRLFQMKLVENAFLHDSMCGRDTFDAVIRIQNTPFTDVTWLFIYWLKKQMASIEKYFNHGTRFVHVISFRCLVRNVNVSWINCGSHVVRFMYMPYIMARKRTFVNLDGSFNCSKSSRRRVNECIKMHHMNGFKSISFAGATITIYFTAKYLNAGPIGQNHSRSHLSAQNRHKNNDCVV